MISFECIQCGKKFRVSDDLIGKSTTCPQCGALLKVPNPNQPSFADVQKEKAEAIEREKINKEHDKAIAQFRMAETEERAEKIAATDAGKFSRSLRTRFLPSISQVLAVLLLPSAVIAFLFGVNFSERFESSNAIGATANALEAIPPILWQFALGMMGIGFLILKLLADILSQLKAINANTYLVRCETVDESDESTE